MPSVWDAITGDYQSSDGWIRLHTNASHHCRVVERVLGPHKHKVAVAGMKWQKLPHLPPLPVQALDHATGYLMAAATIQGLIQRLTQNTGYSARLSLARTANILIDSPYQPDDINLKTSSATTEDYQLQPEMTYWGPALRLRAPLSFNNPMVLGACRLSSWQRYCAVASINRHLTGAGSIAPEKTVQVIDVITEM
ncbi:hypothetical protein [Yersinia enterocolitica]|uniref:hypothetical protein n=1 Tax=Yersinia enterocolitica TaxID=630 RepID=UPI0033900D05